MKILDELEQQRDEEAKKNRLRMDPERLAFADLMRDTFGSGVRLLKTKDWPGGTNVWHHRR